MRVRSTTSPTDEERVSTPVASAVTVTLSLTCPTGSTASTRPFSLTSSVTPSCTTRRKPSFFEGHRIPSNGQVRDQVPAVAIRQGVASKGRGPVPRGDVYLRHDRAGRVANNSKQRSRGRLAVAYSQSEAQR